MSRELERRLARVEREHSAQDGVRYDVSAVPLDNDGNPTGPEPDRELTVDEWAAEVERGAYTTPH